MGVAGNRRLRAPRSEVAAARYVLDLNWEASPLITVSGIGATTVLVATIGVVASLDVLRHKPLATLRAE